MSGDADQRQQSGGHEPAMLHGSTPCNGWNVGIESFRYMPNDMSFPTVIVAYLCSYDGRLWNGELGRFLSCQSKLPACLSFGSLGRNSKNEQRWLEDPVYATQW